jgi:hypothetical protein
VATAAACSQGDGPDVARHPPAQARDRGADQDATVGFNYYLLHLGHNKLAGLVALNAGIALATLFRFWSYRRFVWVTSPTTPDGRKRDALRPLR